MFYDPFIDIFYVYLTHVPSGRGVFRFTLKLISEEQ